MKEGKYLEGSNGITFTLSFRLISCTNHLNLRIQDNQEIKCYHITETGLGWMDFLQICILKGIKTFSCFLKRDVILIKLLT